MIDTCRIIYKNSEKINKHELPFVTKTHLRGDGGISVVIKPSKIYLNSDTSTIKDLDSAKTFLDELFDEKGIITRLDLAYDIESNLEDHKKLYELLIYCMCSIRGIPLPKIFRTESDKPKNLKIRNWRSSFTIYSCDDKPDRIGNTRIENRALRLNISNYFYVDIKNEIDCYISELSTVVEKVPIIEKFLAKSLINEFYNCNYSFSKLHEFVSVYNKKFLTRNVLDIFLRSLDYPGKTENFIDTHHKGKNRIPLKFTNKGSLLELIRDIKNTMKNSFKNQ